MLVEPVDDQVVDDPAGLGREQRVLGLPAATLSMSFESVDCRRSRAVGPSTSISPMCETSKTPGVGANRPVLGDDALVLHGHLPAGERHHPRARGDVPLVERRAAKRLHRGRW